MRKVVALLIGLAFFTQKSFTQVNAEFTANVTEGCGSLTVSFSDNSTSTNGSISSWNWDLGGVNVNTQQAGRIFPIGTYEICLTVTDNTGASDTECKTDFIQVNELPVPNFTSNVTQGCTPLDIEFTDLSTSADGNVVEWIWGVGGAEGVILDDGTLPSISNTYTIPDAYDISLTITDDNGCVGSETFQDYIIVHPNPDLQFSANTNFQCSPPLQVSFSNNNPEPNVIYNWDFGNGVSYEGVTPLVVNYQEPGQFDVQLIGYNTSTNCSDTILMEEYISVGYPVDFTFDKTEVCEGDTVFFQDLSPVAADTKEWDFGDGNTSALENPFHIFNSPGCYTVSLSRFQNSCTTTVESDVCIEVIGRPAASYIADNLAGCILPHDVSFQGTSPDAIEWFWEFGENSEMGTSTQQNPNVSFTEFGIYPIYLNVTNADGCTNRIVTDTIKIIDLNALMPGGEIKGCAPLSVTLQDASATSTPITSWYWEIDTPSGMLSSTDQFPNFTIPDTGCYNVLLAVTNESGCIDTSIINNIICVGMPPDVDFNATPTNACINSDVFFTNMSSSYANEFYWEFGDSTFSFVKDPQHEYVDTGSFNVTLVSTHHGCSNSITKNDFINTLAPRAAFGVEHSCDNPYTVTFQNTTIGADSISWDFGDMTSLNDTSSFSLVDYVYPDTGGYNVRLIAYNFDTGCVDSSVVEVFVSDPKTNFSLDNLSGCAPFEVAITNASEFAESYHWSVSSGTFSDTLISEPSLTFDMAGVYNDLKLVIVDRHECKDSMILADEILVNAVTADFNLDPSFGCNPLTVDFTDLSSSFLGNVNTWSWNIENGLHSDNSPNTTFTFDIVGKYSTTLTVTDDWGCVDSLVVPDGIDVTQPSAKFKADTLGCTVSTINFLNQSLGNGLDYLWDFGDGNTSILKNPTHEYLAEGVYTVCLYITDQNGCTDSICEDDYISIADPIADFTSDGQDAACPPLIVLFENQSQNALTYEWNFGDGSGSSSLENPPHVYTQPGLFDVSLIAILNDACRDTIEIEEFIQLDGPIGQFNLSYSDPCIPTEVTFVAESNDFYTYIWDFGDGVLDTSGYRMTDTITHLYSTNANFLPNLILIDNQGCSRPIPPIDTLNLVFLENDFEAAETEVCSGSSILFSNNTESSIEITSLEWIFEGGMPTTSIDMEPEVTYDIPGTYEVTLIVDNGMCKDTLVKENYIKVNAMPTVDFAMTPNEGCAPLVVSFSDISTVAFSTVDKWDWNFGNGNTSTLKNPIETFNVGGDYSIKLIATTNQGCVDSTSQMLTVFPKVFLSVSNDTTICNGENVQLQSSILGDTTGIDFYWESHPDLSCTDCFDPIVTSTDTTTFTFVAISQDNCQYEASVSVNVRAESIPEIVISPDTTICAGDEAQIFATGGDDLFGYQWDNSVPGLSCYDACLNPIATPLSNSTYSVTVTNATGCSNTASTNVNVFYEFQNLLGEDRTICKGDATQLEVLNGNAPVWLVSNGLSCSVCPDPMATPEVTTTYIVQVESDFGCLITDSITINVLAEEAIDAGDDVDICFGQSIQLEGIGDGIPSWGTSPFLNQTDISNPIATPEITTTFYFSIGNGNCTLTDSVTVYVEEKTEIELLDQYVCEGESIVLQPIGFADTYDWFPTEGLSETNIENPTATPTEDMEYTVIATLGSCESDTATALIEILEKPEISVAPVFRFFPGEPVLLDVPEVVGGQYAYQWSPSFGLSCNDCSAPTANIDSSTTYTVIVTDLLTGCFTSKEIIVERADECNEDLISMPNAFSPNGDGNNDTYQMYSGVIDEINYIRVFDRWGAMVYESNNRYFQWNGRYNDKKLPRGVYVYLLSAKCNLNGSTIIKKGDITLHY